MPDCSKPLTGAAVMGSTVLYGSLVMVYALALMSPRSR